MKTSASPRPMRALNALLLASIKSILCVALIAAAVYLATTGTARSLATPSAIRAKVDACSAFLHEGKALLFPEKKEPAPLFTRASSEPPPTMVAITRRQTD